jgi:uncharacterized protein (TIGR03086 family)
VLDLQPAALTLARTATSVRDDQLDEPTPCDVPVATLLVHVLGLSAAFRESGRKARGPLTANPPRLVGAELAPDWREQLRVLLDELVTTWQRPGAWDGTTQIAGLEMPAVEVGFVANDELVLHAWDLAVATGQAYDPHPDNLEAAWVMVSSTPDDPAARGGLFGPRLPVPADAPLLDRVLAGAGRDPQWGASTWRWRVPPEDELEETFRRDASRARG